MGKLFCRSRVSNSEVNDPTRPKLEIIRNFMPVLDTCKSEEVTISTGAIILTGQLYPHYKSVEPICGHGNKF